MGTDLFLSILESKSVPNILNKRYRRWEIHRRYLAEPYFNQDQTDQSTLTHIRTENSAQRDQSKFVLVVDFSAGD